MSVIGSNQTTEFASPTTSVERNWAGIGGSERVRRAVSAWRARAAERRAWRKTVDATVMADLGPPLHELIRDISKAR